MIYVHINFVIYYVLDTVLTLYDENLKFSQMNATSLSVDKLWLIFPETLSYHDLC